MAKLAETSEAAIVISFLVMNLERILSLLLYFLSCFCRRQRITLRTSAAGAQNRSWNMQIAA